MLEPAEILFELFTDEFLKEEPFLGFRFCFK